MECVNQAYYTGITINPSKRWGEHQLGIAAKYTRSYPPKKMVALWKIDGGRGLAQKIEWQIKSLSRQKKQRLITNPNSLSQIMTGIDSLDNIVELGDLGSFC